MIDILNDNRTINIKSNEMKHCSQRESSAPKYWQSEGSTTHLATVAHTRSVAVRFAHDSILHVVIGVSTEAMLIKLKENVHLLLRCGVVWLGGVCKTTEWFSLWWALRSWKNINAWHVFMIFMTSTHKYCQHQLTSKEDLRYNLLTSSPARRKLPCLQRVKHHSRVMESFSSCKSLIILFRSSR